MNKISYLWSKKFDYDLADLTLGILLSGLFFLSGMIFRSEWARKILENTGVSESLEVWLSKLMMYPLLGASLVLGIFLFFEIGKTVLICGGNLLGASTASDIRKYLTTWQGLSLALGAGFGVLGWFAMILGFLGLLNWIVCFVSLCIFLLLIRPFFPLNCYKSIPIKVVVLVRNHPILTSFLLLWLVFRWLQTLLPANHGDPLYYHLASAWQYSKMEKIFFTPWAPWFLQGGIGEYLYSLVALWIDNRMALLIIAQGIHFFFAYPATFMVILLISKTLRLPTPWCLVAGLGGLTFAAGSDALIAAKNDGFVLFLSLLSFAYTLSFLIASSRWFFFASCIFAALAFATKLTAAFYILPLVAIILMFGHRQWRQIPYREWCLLAVTCLTLMIPNLLRNYLWTSNPFFPAFPDLFQSSYHAPYQIHMVKMFSYSPGSLWEIALDQLKNSMFSKALFPLSLMGFLRIGPLSRVLSTFIVLTVVILSVVTGRGTYARFTFFLDPVMAIAGVQSTVFFVQKFFPLFILRGQTLFIIFVLITAGGNIEMPFLNGFKRFFPFLASDQTWGDSFANQKPSYNTHRWMNSHCPKGRVLSFGDNETLFLDFPLSVPENEVNASQVVFQDTIEEFVATFDQVGFRYVLIPEKINFNYRKIWQNDPQWEMYFHLVHQNNVKIYERDIKDATRCMKIRTTRF